MANDTLRSKEKVYESTSFWHTSSPINDNLDSTLHYLKSIGEKASYPQNAMLFKQGEYIKHVYFIEKGLVKYSLNNIEGKEKIVGYTDGFIRLDGVFHQQPIICNVTAMNDVEAILVKREHLPELLSHPEVVEALLEALSREVRVLGWQIYDQCLMTNREKVCRALYVSKVTAEDSQVYVYLKHHEIADMCGIHRVTVTRLLSELQSEGIILLEGKGLIKITHVDRLESLGFGKIY